MLPTMRAIPSSDRDVGGPNLFVGTKALWCGGGREFFVKTRVQHDNMFRCLVI